MAKAIEAKGNVLEQSEPSDEELVELEDILIAEGEDITTNPALNKAVRIPISSVLDENDEEDKM